MKSEVSKHRDLDVVTECVLLVFITKTRVCQQAKNEVFIGQYIARRSHAFDGYNTESNRSAHCYCR